MTSPECSDCGTVKPGRPGKPPVCLPCQLKRKLVRLLDDGTGKPAGHLAALVEYLRRDSDPEKVLHWLSRSGPADLVVALATGQLDLNHEALHAWPRPIPARHLQHQLIACGLLPPVDQHLLRFEAWTQRRLAALAAHPHERLLRRFALWQQLPRLRADAAVRPLRATAATYAINQFNAAVAFLDWLNSNKISPAAAKQADLDAWAIASGVGHRQWVQGFLSWATSTSAMPRRLTLARTTFTPRNPISQQQRLALLRQHLTADSLPLRERTAACLMLLFGQPISRIHRLHRDDLHQADDTLTIGFGDPPTPVPEPLAGLLRDLAASAPEPGWLFPGRNAGQPVTHQTLHRSLRKLGFPIGQARISALRHLVAQVPPPVIADALGIHPTTANRQAVNAGVTWSRYPAARVGHSPLS